MKKHLKSTDVVFPHITEEDVRALTIGIDQVNQTRAYATEHLNKKKNTKSCFVSLILVYSVPDIKVDMLS